MVGMTTSSKRTVPAAFADSTDETKRQFFAEWGVQVDVFVHSGSTNTNGSSTACSFCGRHRTLDQCLGVQNLIAQHKSRQLTPGGISKSLSHRVNSWRTKKPVQLGARVRAPFADRGGRNGGGNSVSGGNNGGGGHGNRGHYGNRGSPSGHSLLDDSRRHFKRLRFSSSEGFLRVGLLFRVCLLCLPSLCDSLCCLWRARSTSFRYQMVSAIFLRS